jgi:hypothetical protein
MTPSGHSGARRCYNATKMQPHRVSYIKTTVAGLGISASASIVAVYLLGTGQISIPILGRILTTFPMLYWPSVGGIALLAVLGLMVGAGGLISLQRDARESGGSRVWGTQGR